VAAKTDATDWLRTWSAWRSLPLGVVLKLKITGVKFRAEVLALKREVAGPLLSGFLIDRGVTESLSS